MRKLISAGFLFAFLFVPSNNLWSIGLIVAGGGDQITPRGHFRFKGIELNAVNDLGYQQETFGIARIRIDSPLFLPNIYLAAQPLSFSGTGSKEVSFVFGEKEFEANKTFSTTLKMDHYDVALFYGIPFVETVTRKKINVDFGLNLRIINFETEITQDSPRISESKKLTVPVPMGFVAFQIRPIDRLHFNGEIRGIAYAENQYIDATARIKLNIFKLLFASVGYKYQTIKIDQSSVLTDLIFAGPTAEIGFSFGGGD